MLLIVFDRILAVSYLFIHQFLSVKHTMIPSYLFGIYYTYMTGNLIFNRKSNPSILKTVISDINFSTSQIFFWNVLSVLFFNNEFYYNELFITIQIMFLIEEISLIKIQKTLGEINKINVVQYVLYVGNIVLALRIKNAMHLWVYILLLIYVRFRTKTRVSVLGISILFTRNLYNLPIHAFIVALSIPMIEGVNTHSICKFNIATYKALKIKAESIEVLLKKQNTIEDCFEMLVSSDTSGVFQEEIERETRQQCLEEYYGVECFYHEQQYAAIGNYQLYMYENELEYIAGVYGAYSYTYDQLSAPANALVFEGQTENSKYLITNQNSHDCVLLLFTIGDNSLKNAGKLFDGKTQSLVRMLVIQRRINVFIFKNVMQMHIPAKIIK